MNMENRPFIRSIQLKNFLSFGPDSEEIKLEPLNVLIGANTSGKSNFLDAFRFLRDLASAGGGFQESVGRRDGITAIRVARAWPWFVLVDLDNDAECAPLLCAQWVPVPAPYLCFRVAVRKVEAWLMADGDSLAAFLGIGHNRIPAEPEQLDDPKVEMVNLARLSRRLAIRKDMVPRQGSGRSIGPAYASRLIGYVQTAWRPDKASGQAESLRRAIDCLRRIIEEVSE